MTQQYLPKTKFSIKARKYLHVSMRYSHNDQKRISRNKPHPIKPKDQNRRNKNEIVGLSHKFFWVRKKK